MAINHWESIDVTSSRRPLLLPGESSVYVQDGVGLYSGKHKVHAYQNGVIYLTEQRICYVDSAQPTIRSVALDLQYVDKIEHQAGFLKSSPKISIRYVSESGSSNGTSGRNTPIPAALVPHKKKPTRDWICSICTFTNEVLQDYVDGEPLPVCINCGMRPKKNTKIYDHVATKLPDNTVGIHSPLDGTPVSASMPKALHEASFRCPRCTFANHPAIASCELCGAPLISRNLPPMLQSNSNADERHDVVLPGSSSANVQDNTSCKLSFRAGGDKTFLDKLRKVVADRAWTKEISTNLSNLTVSATQMPSTKGAGISALQNRGEHIRSMDAETMSGAFEDLQGLMARAKDMIALAESFANRVAANPALAGTVDAQSLIVESSLALGLSSAVVTKEAFGQTAVYHGELARQIAEFLDLGRLRQEGGCITLVDLYAIYNRARKGSTISPEDLVMACRLFDELKLPVMTRQFRSGIIVVQDRGRSDDSIRRLVVHWLSERTTGITAIDAADRFGWSVGIAQQELEMVEEAGHIVRDSGVEGLRFFNNIFPDWDSEAWRQSLNPSLRSS